MKKILIVDDAPDMRELLTGILSEKYQTLCAASGAEAIELFGREKPDMVLSELTLPQMSGLELQRELVGRSGAFVPFVFMSDDRCDDNERLSLEAGAMDYVGKPFRREVLLRRVENTMRQIDSLEQIQGLKAVAETDPMTGLLNKAFAQKELAELCPKASGVLMMIDLDNFKLVNDLYGHGMGDRVLIRFAEILRGLIRASDVVGRMGGDEFIVFCRDIRDERLVAEKANAINSSLLAAAKELMGEDMTVPIGASVGAVFVPDGGTVFSELYRKADKALYTVKRNGKHGYLLFCENEDHGGDTVSPRDAAPLALACKVLEERTHQPGAYEVGFENFRTMYRFFVRVMENYHYDAELAVFYFDPDVSDDAMDAFGTLLRQTLRRSDVYTRGGANRYMVLLPQPIPDHGIVAIRRILGKWSQSEHYAPVSYEHEAVYFAG